MNTVIVLIFGQPHGSRPDDSFTKTSKKNTCLWRTNEIQALEIPTKPLDPFVSRNHCVTN